MARMFKSKNFPNKYEQSYNDQLILITLMYLYKLFNNDHDSDDGDVLSRES